MTTANINTAANNSNEALALNINERADGVSLQVFGGFDAYSSDLLVSMLCKSKEALYSPEEATMFADECLEDDGIEFDGPDFASGLLRLSGIAVRKDSAQPAAMGLAHVYVQANRGFHEDLGHMLKLHFDIGAGHVHRMGVGLGLHEQMAQEMVKQVLGLVEEFKRTSKEDMTVMWSFEVSMSACENMELRAALHRGLLDALYAPLLHVTDDSVVA